MNNRLETIVDLKKYPIQNLNSPLIKDLIKNEPYNENLIKNKKNEKLLLKNKIIAMENKNL